MKKLLGLIFILAGLGALYVATMTVMNGFYLLAGIRITSDASFVPFIIGGVLVFTGISLVRN